MASFTINEQHNINGDKIGLNITLHADGKPDKTFYHEIENFVSTDGKVNKEEGLPTDETRDFWLQKLADDYQNS